ncbi:MAG: cyclic-phosphate processing receiver domain-containing protein [Phycisphaeraceae bacterium]
MCRSEVLILDDENARVERFKASLAIINMSLTVWSERSAHDWIEGARARVASACLISLDHDLYPPAGSDEDWGDGLIAAKYLATCKPTCPVIVHSSNADAARHMVGELELAGWDVHRALPLGSDWIESDWAVLVRELLAPSSTSS